MYVVIGSSAMLNGHCNDHEEYDRISCSAASETQVIYSKTMFCRLNS